MLFGALEILELDRPVAAFTPWRQQRAEARVAIEARQAAPYDAAPPVDLQEVVLPQDFANNTGMSSTSTGGSKGGGPRRADASDSEALPMAGTDLADNTNMSTTSTTPSSPQPRPRPGGGVKAQAAMG